jgi:hypothetical protein
VYDLGCGSGIPLLMRLLGVRATATDGLLGRV